MKKIFILAFFMISFVATMVTYGMNKESNLISVDRQNWMGYINDNVKLSMLSIPGTHESMATKGIIGYGVCQNSSLITQLNNGIRYLDIRCRANNKNNDNFDIYHGSIAQGTKFKENVLEPSIDYLKKHPKETIFMRIKQEYSSISDNEFKFIFDNCIKKFPQNFFWNNPNEKNPTLGELRGKIVILYDVAGLNFGLSYSHRLTIQDYYKTSDSTTKLNYIKEFLEKSNSNIMDSNIYLNYLSAQGNIIETPANLSLVINPTVNQYLSEKIYLRTGFLAIDFPSNDLVDSIIKVNNNLEKYINVINVPDASLKAALNKTIDSNRADDQNITQLELESLKGQLNLNSRKISNLEGMQYCTNINELYLRDNNISDL